MTLWDSKRSLDLPPVPPQCHSKGGKRREGREQQGTHQCNQGPRSILETDGAQEGGKQGGEALSWDPISTLQPQGCGGFTGEGTEAVQGWDLLRFLL